MIPRLEENQSSAFLIDESGLKEAWYYYNGTWWREKKIS